MLIADIRHHLTTSYVVHSEFVDLCAGNIQASNLLAYLFWWTDVADGKYPERNGWTWQTASDLFAGLKLSRRGYQKARKKLLEMGILQYRRSGVFGKMHWKLNKEKLVELIYKLKGEDVPEWASEYQHDADNFRLPKWVPLDLWNAFLKMRSEKNGQPIKHGQKKRLLSKLQEFYGKDLDLRLIMEKAIAAGWATFYEASPTPAAAAQPKQESPEEVLKKVEAERKQWKDEPPPDKDMNNEGRLAILNRLKLKKAD